MVKKRKTKLNTLVKR